MDRLRKSIEESPPRVRSVAEEAYRATEVRKKMKINADIDVQLKKTLERVKSASFRKQQHL